MEERFLVVIDQIEVSPVLEEALYDGGLGWFVESGRVKSRVTVIISSVDRSPALQQKIYGWYRREVTDGISPDR